MLNVCAECRDLFIDMLNVVMLSVVTLNVVILSVVAPFKTTKERKILLRKEVPHHLVDRHLAK